MKDITGKKFGRLTVICKTNKRKHGHIVWKCKCDCGNDFEVIGKTLRNGKTTSCGCYKKEINTTHGESRTRLYNIWEHIVSRTCNVNNDRYYDYGGRGISICKEWESYENFSNWAKENGYNDLLTIDRIDVNGNYEPSNCRWTTELVQANNRRNNVYLEYEGKKMSLKDWSRVTGLSYDTIRSRYRRGWSIEKILKTTKQNYL